MQSGSAIKKIQSDINNSLSALRMYNVDISNWDCILIYLCSARLPTLTLSLWEQSSEDKTGVSAWEDFYKFLTSRYQTLETVSDIKSSSHNEVHFHSKNIKAYQTKVNNPVRQLCPNEQHTIRSCVQFLKMSVDEHSKFIKKNGLCLNCFSKVHSFSSCSSKHNCFTFLNSQQNHSNPKSTQNNSFQCNATKSYNSNTHAVSIHSTPSTDLLSTSQNIHSCFASSSAEVLLGSALVQIVRLGTYYPVRALIESGYEGSFISEKLFNFEFENSFYCSYPC